MTFGRRLADLIDTRGRLCVGIDPHPALLDAWGLTDSAVGLERFALTAAEVLAGTVAAAGGGGLSGAPLTERATAVTRLLRDVIGPDLALVGVGGISTPEDARARLDAGADLVQAYTAFVYEGPTWPRRVNRALAAGEGQR